MDRAFGEQLQRGERDEERIWSCRIRHAEGRQHRAALRSRQPGDLGEDGMQQLMQTGERKMRFRLHA